MVKVKGLCGPDIRSVITAPNRPPRKPPEQRIAGRVVSPFAVAPLLISSSVGPLVSSGKTTGSTVWQAVGIVSPSRPTPLIWMLSLAVALINVSLGLAGFGVMVPVTGPASLRASLRLIGMKPNSLTVAVKGGQAVFASREPGIVA